MTPDALAALHAAAFTTDRAWGAGEFTDLLNSPYVTVFTQPGGFALVRTLAEESELLTLAVDSAEQRRGIGTKLLLQWLTAVRPVAQMAFLEVASDNAAALALYQKHCFSTAGLRRGYYARKDRPAADALLMQRDLTLGQHGLIPGVAPESG